MSSDYVKPMFRGCIYCLFLLFAIGKPLRTNGQSAPTTLDPTRWLNYNQSYYKIPIAANGIYRITSAEFQKAGVPLDRIHPQTIQLFHRGIEQAIYVSGEADGRIDTDDFLEFYGQANDGTADSLLYHSSAAQPHTYYSLFNDTTAYFLTWRDGIVGKRMHISTDTSGADLSSEPFYWSEETRLFTENYPGWPNGITPQIEYSQYEAGEGYTGMILQKDSPAAFSFLLTNASRTGPAPVIDILVTGRNFSNHNVQCLAGPTPANQRLIDSARFSTYTNVHIRSSLAWSDVDADGRFTISTIARGESNNLDNYSLSYINVRYPKAFVGNGDQNQFFQLAENPAGRSLVSLTNVLPASRFWDITDPGNPIQLSRPVYSDSVRLVVHHTESARKLFSTNRPQAVPAIMPVRFTDFSTRKPGYVIITHEALQIPINDPASGTSVKAITAYASYRASASGGGYDTLTVTMQQLVDQFNYGERSPLAIYSFMHQMRQQSRDKLQYLLLLGRSRSTPGIRRNPNQATMDMVMTAGYPGSDMLFTAGPDGVPAIPTGRINAGTAQEVIGYLHKVKEYESQADAGGWRKNFLHLSGGQSPGERNLFRQLVDNYRLSALAEPLGAYVSTVAKETDNPVESINVSKQVNEGVGMMTFFGHSGLDVTDLSIGFCSNDAFGYQNKGRYPFLLVNGCAIGDFFFGRPTLATDWVLTPNRGAIAALATSHLGQTDVMHRYTTAFYSLLADSTQFSKSIGQLQQETIRRVLANSTDGRDLANCQQMVLQGDPAVRLFPFDTPNYELTAGGLTVTAGSHPTTTNQPLTSLSDSVQIRAIVRNTGLYTRKPLAVQVVRRVNGQEIAVYNQTFSTSVAFQDTLLLTFPNQHDTEGENEFAVTVNPADAPFVQQETNRTTNQASVRLLIPGPKPVLIYPPQNGMVQVSTLLLTAYSVSPGLSLFDIELDSTATFDSSVKQTRRVRASGTIHVPMDIPAHPDVTYYWRVRLANDPSSNAWSSRSFVYAPASTASGLPEGQLWLTTPLPTDIQQGDIISMEAKFSNLSPFSFTDSLVVQQTIYAAGLSNPQTQQWVINAPTGNTTVRIVTNIPTEKLPGLNRILLTVNPRLQPEYSFLNNTLDLPVAVRPDSWGPMLEVAVDSARITNDAVVSARPVIDMLVVDENRSLVQRDTSGLNLYLQRPGSTIFERLNWGKAIRQPSVSGNALRLRYTSPILIEGAYQLLATARDVVGNPAVPYQVRFRIVKDRQLTSVTAFPNPFRDHTLFSIHLTGDVAPSQLFLTLSTLTGRLVRHAQLSPRIGLNEWLWDGRDDNNNLLPAGIYVYNLSIIDDSDWSIADNHHKRISGRILLIR